MGVGFHHLCEIIGRTMEGEVGFGEEGFGVSCGPQRLFVAGNLHSKELVSFRFGTARVSGKEGVLSSIQF